MSKCPICELAEKPSPDVVFINDKVIVVVPDHALAMGHVQVFPRNHAAIIEQMSHDDVAELFSAGNMLSSVLFQLLQAQGTNLILQNGVAAGQSIAHVSLHVIPRRENDGLDFTWKMDKADANELKSSAELIKDHLIPTKEKLVAREDKPIDMEKPKPAPIEHSTKEDGTPKVNYLLKQLHRLP